MYTILCGLQICSPTSHFDPLAISLLCSPGMGFPLSWELTTLSILPHTPFTCQHSTDPSKVVAILSQIGGT